MPTSVVTERVRSLVDCGAHGLGRLRIHRGELVRLLLERSQHGVAAILEEIEHRRTAVLQGVDDIAAAFLERAERRFADRSHFAGNRLATVVERCDETVAARLEQLADLRDAVAESTEHGATFLVERGRDAVETVDHPLLEGVDALVERACDLFGARAEDLVDVACARTQDFADLLGPGRKRLGDHGALGGDSLADFVRARLQGVRNLSPAFRHHTSHLAGADDERLVQRGRPCAERLVDAHDQRIEVGRDFVRAACRMLFEGVKLRLDGAARFAAAFREGVGERFSLDGDQPIHFLEPSAHRVGRESRPLSKSARTGSSRDS